MIPADAYVAEAAIGMFQIESQENGQVYGLLEPLPEPEPVREPALKPDPALAAALELALLLEVGLALDFA
jgi:hypothetical protein